MSEPQNPQTSASAWKQYRKWLAVAVGGLALVGLFFAGRWFFTCPCDFTPGSVLWGETVDERITDWSFANDVPLCQIQVQAGITPPHAVNLNCMATEQGELYLSCSNCGPKRWSTLAERDSEARIRLDGRVYPVTVTRVTDPAEKDRSWEARLEKLQHFDVPGSGTPVGTPRPSDEAWWTFRVVSRAS